jgi:hypothetical protein
MRRISRIFHMRAGLPPTPRPQQVSRDHQILQRTVPHRLDLSSLGRAVPLHRLALHFVVFVYANVARVAEYFLFMPVQQRMACETCDTFADVPTTL